MPQPFLTSPPGSSFIELRSVDNTNNYARSLLQQGGLPDEQGLAQHGTVVFAHEQLAGKGQRGRGWISEKGANIITSMLVNPQKLQLAQQFQLSACVSVAVQKFFGKYAGDDTKIKWPNDLYWQDRKAGGVLIESIVGSQGSGAENWKWAIIGIGININQTNFPSWLPNPVSLKQITGKNFETVDLAKELAAQVYKCFDELIDDGFEKIYAAYLDHLYKKNSTVKLKKDNRAFDAMIKTVSPSGKLIIEHGIEEEIDFGEVEWII